MEKVQFNIDEYPPKSDLGRLVAAIDSPYFDGAIATACCKSCGMSVLSPSPDGRTWAAYVLMDGSLNPPDFDEHGNLKGNAFVQWGGDSAPIVAALNHAGFSVAAPPDGTVAIRIANIETFPVADAECGHLPRPLRAVH